MTFVWALESPERLSRRAVSALRNGEASLEISVISRAEIAIKHRKGKLNLAKDDARAGIDDFNVRVLPYTADHAWRMYSLPAHHGDPFDRQIIAQALSEEVPVVTPDSMFKLYSGISVVW